MAEEADVSGMCFGCGEDNPHGLKMRFQLEQGRAVAEYTPPNHLQGFPGHMHGGAIATMLDEAMGWAVYTQGIWAMTARFGMRFRDAALVEEPLTVAGWVTRDRGRFLELRADVRAAGGKVIAEAEGMFVRVDGERAEAIRRQYEASIR